MTKKLWTGTVSVEFEMAIYAETAQEALKIARRHAHEELDNCGPDLECVVRDSAPPEEFDGYLPWGDFDGPEKTVAQLKLEMVAK